MVTKYVTYCRVSTKEQGDSRLGLEAQKRINQAYIDSVQGQLVKEYTEVVSARYLNKIYTVTLENLLSKRPALYDAIEYCRKNDATLVVKDLSRLGRSQLLISYLIQRGVKFLCAESPTDSPFILQIKAALFEEEAKRISIRTKEALASLKARGVKLGKPENLKRKEFGAKARRTQARQEYKALIKFTLRLSSEGHPLRAIAHELTEAGFVTKHGKAFHATTVKRIIERENEKELKAS